ncbi:MAG: DUF11 domain-containing protein [Anaerolineae bacterium]|nr:DUF11 domain-containing protein [Anaerolineae bacterium]
MRLRIFLALLFGLLLVSPTLAVELPPTGSQAFLQTNGPNTELGVGDFYTQVGSGNAPHFLDVLVPCPAVNDNLTFAIFDPEMGGANTAVAPFILDQPRDPNPVPPPDFLSTNTTFSLLTPNGTTYGPTTFTPPPGTPNRLWVELQTLNPSLAANGCGTYTVQATTANIGDNGWRLRVSYDDDCTLTPGTCTGIGAAQSALMNTSGTDGADAVAGNGDELAIVARQVSMQHVAQSCVPYFFFIDAGAGGNITINNFDMDINFGDPAATITYFRPGGGAVAGTPSNQANWNGGANNNAQNPNPPRVGDVVPVTAADTGWWRAEVCVGNGGNQYIFEGVPGVDLFMQQPPAPNMVVTKSDGLTFYDPNGQDVTYTITYSNTGLGAATNVTLTDTLPGGGTFVSCTGGCAGVGPVTWNIGQVNAGGGGSVTVTVALPAAGVGNSVTNTVSLAYEDILGNAYPVETAVDNSVSGIAPTATPAGVAGGIIIADPFITKVANPPFALPGENVTFTVTVTNPSAVPAANVVVNDPIPNELEVLSASATGGSTSVSGQTVTLTIPTLNPGATVMLTIQTRVRANVATPFTIINVASLNNGKTASASVVSVGRLPATGETPWWRDWLVALTLLSITTLFIRTKITKATK